MLQENLLETIQKLPRKQPEFVYDTDPILLHLNEVVTRNRGINRQKNALVTYQTYVSQIAEALLGKRQQKLTAVGVDKIISNATRSLEGNLVDDFYFGAVFKSGSAQQRILLAQQIGFITEDHINWAKLIAEKRTNILNIFIYKVEDLQRYGLELKPLKLTDPAEEFMDRFQQILELLHIINNYLADSTQKKPIDFNEVENELRNTVTTIYESWLKPHIQIPNFYGVMLMQHALKKQLNETNKAAVISSQELAAAHDFAEKHDYEYDTVLGIFRSKQPKRAT